MNKMGVVKTIKMVRKIENRHSWFIYTPTEIQAKKQQDSYFIIFFTQKHQYRTLYRANPYFTYISAISTIDFYISN